MRIIIPLLLISAFFLVGCDDQNAGDTGPDKPDETQIDLNNPLPGQQTMYIGYQQNCDSTNFRWTGDTLLTEIHEDAGALYMSEQFTAGSPSYQGPGAEVVYPISSEAGVVTLPQRQFSALFSFYGSDQIHLQPSNRIDLTQSGCLISTDDAIFVGDDIGHIERFDFGPISVEDKTTVSCVPVINIDAYLIYDSHQLYVSHQVNSTTFWGDPLGTDVRGWVMVE